MWRNTATKDIEQYEVPHGEIEEKLADIWSEMFGIDRSCISRNDNFFELGGHSLLAVQLLAKLRETELDTTIQKVFDTESLATLASNLTQYKAVVIPPNLITKDSSEITPEMLPLATLSQVDIETIITHIPGGVSNIQDIYGLTPLQSAMKYQHIVSKGRDPFLIAKRLQFIDRNSLERYTKAVLQVIERHDFLRIAIFWTRLSEPAQVVLRRIPPLLSKITLDESDKPERELEQFCRELNAQRYHLDLIKAPLTRLIAAPESGGKWMAAKLIHHSISDCLTQEILHTEIHAITNGNTEMLKSFTPFRHFVAQARLESNTVEHTRFFTEMLGDIDEPTLPFGLNNVDQDGPEIKETDLMLPQTLNDQLRTHARNLRVSLASICHLACAQVVAKASRREAVVFGTVLLGRLQGGEGNHTIVGPMINTLPIQLNIDDRSVLIVVRETHARLSALLAREHASLVLAQRCSGVPAGLPLFSALLNYRRNHRTEEVNKSLPGVTFLDNVGQTNYPLTLAVDDDDGSLHLSVQVVSQMSAARICTYMEQALESMANALTHTPYRSIRQLTVMSAYERNLLLYSWNQTTVIHSSASCLHQLFEAQLECNGQAIAVEFEGHTLTYSELNIQANRLAHYLIAQSVKPDDRIALCVERSTVMIAAMLGILKAGCAYVPLDPVYPSQRLTNSLLDVNPILLLADETGRNALGKHQIPVIGLEKPLGSDLSIDSPNTTKIGLTPDHLAYVIYTSGSTGKPKGVMVEHCQIVRHLSGAHNQFDFSEQDKWCLFHSISFDLSLSELWGALWHGGQVYIVPHHIMHSIDEFYDWICNNGISVLLQIPTVFKILMRAKNINSRSNKLRYIICGGEKLDPMIVRDWYKEHDIRKTILVNRYGPTETVLNAAYYFCNTTFSEGSVIPVGRPLSSKLIYLLDQDEPVLLGAEGEICIGGACVSRGYFNRPDLTVERFLPDPFNNMPAARIYRTGDLARYLPDGNLVFLGRADQQVKIRGFRIEPGEIEARLVEHPEVHDAVVQAYGDRSDTILVAYVVADASESLVQNLRTYLMTSLPDYMVPSAYVRLSSLPLTPNGKLNRRALPAPDDEAYARQNYDAPQGEIEEKLAQIWRELLSIDRVGRHDNFFALGGHSLVIVKLLAQLRQLGLDTTVREVFDAQSLAILALTLTRYKALTIPPNLITNDSTEITPKMLPLITLSQSDIDAIIAQIPGGVANIQDIYGLTPLQNSILFHHLMAKQSDPYLIVRRLSFIDRRSLERYVYAMQRVIERHDILRTAIFWDGLSEPAQVVLRQVPSLLSETTLHESDKPELEQLSREINAHPHHLDLTKAPLIRLIATPEFNDNCVAMEIKHHLISDHSTQERLHAEIHAIMIENTKALKPSMSFRHFVAQARLVSDTAEHTRFFTEMLGDIDEPILPFDLNDVDQDGSEIIESNLKLSQTLNDQLRAHARNLQVSLASICHLAWAQVVAKTSRREAVVFGTVLLGRLQGDEGNNSIMGPMINTLPIRLNIDDRGVQIVVRDIHTRLSALLVHEHTSLVVAQQCSGVPSGLPLFSALLNYVHNQTTVDNHAVLPGITFSDNVGRTNYPLTLSVDDDDGSLHLSVQVVSQMSAERICTYMEQALESMANALTQTPQRPIQKLTVMPGYERALLLYSWNQTIVIPSPACCLHQLFEAQLECNGQAIAVEYEGHTLTYSELNIQANRIAHYIIAQGVKPDDRIALFVERSTEMIAAILGILKAGCGYVPLGPAYSSQRLTRILLDSNPVFILSDETGLNVLGDHQIHVIELEKLLRSDMPIHNPVASEIGLIPSHLAYMIYTSGSTGTPKGVMVEHKQIVRLFDATRLKFDFNNRDKWCLFHSISFDFSVWELWGALLHGSQLSILSYDTVHNTDEFHNKICRSGITVLNQTPSAFKMLMRTRNINLQQSSLRYIILGGEWLDPLVGKEWLKKHEKCATVLVNMYGITETTVHVTFQRIQTSKDINAIGRPLQDLSVYLLDSCGEPVLLETVGEIHINGAGVARGYFNRSDLTAERFLPDPFSVLPAARMYRTGDLARYLPDGNLVFLGRADQQVKIRGFRIELGEIEARLIEHHQVREAVVQPFGEGSDVCLVAYVVADTGESLVQNLRTFLMSLLPDYMVPSAYVRLSSLPLTSNGKLNRRALPAPDDDAYARQHYEDPQDEMEQKLAQIWRELLSIDRVGRHDNFFALGGHSLLIVKLLAKLRQLELATTVREVFDAQSLAMLASTLTRYKAVTIPPNLITKDSNEITPEMLPLITLSQADIDAIVAQIPGGVANIQDIYGLTPLQNSMLFHHLMAEQNDPFLTQRRLSFIDRKSLDQYVDAMQRVIERHDILRTAIFWDGLSEPAQVVVRQVLSLLSEIPLSEFDDRHHLDLTRAPLIRLIATPKSEGSWLAVQLMHHSIIDNVTLECLCAEIHAIVNRRTEVLTKTTAFRHFVAQARLVSDAVEHTRFFTELLGDIDEPTLAFGLHDVHQDGSEIIESDLKLSQKLNDQLRAHARNLQVSLASICHLAWAQVVAKTSGREKVVFGTVLLGRLQGGEGNNTIMGPMINTLPIRLNIDDRCVEISVRNAHSQLSSLLAHEHAPFILAQRCSGVPASSPLFSTLLNYRHKQAIEVNKPLPGITFLDSVGRTNFPLTLAVDDDDSSWRLSVRVVSLLSADRICAYMLQSLESLVDALTHTSHRSIRQLRVMPEYERTLLLHSWNQTTVIHSPACCLHQLFEAQMECDGQAIAVEHNSQTLTYLELNIQANRLAHYLIAQGVKPDDRIVLCIERSVAMMVAILGILKAGGVCVPLDAAHQSQRLTNSLLDANAAFLIADKTGHDALGNHQVPEIVLEQPLPSNLLIGNPSATKIGLTPANLAYVIYTSGSTGTPKGVMIEHCQAVRHLMGTHDQFDFSKQDKWCLFHSISYVMSLSVIWGPLLSGGELLILPYNILHSSDEFYDWICTKGISVIIQTPSLFKILMRAKCLISRVDHLRYVMFGGEMLDPLILRDWYEKFDNGKTILVYRYGSTESVMIVRICIFDSTFSEKSTISVGSAPNKLIYLLDSQGEPVPLGGEGEIYVGGIGIARGYFNRPDLTAERFLPDPFSNMPSARMYRTGDLARFMPDGNLVFLGRADQQVKIRGFRIELGEIEARLIEHPQVSEVAVQPYGDGSDACLVAYVVADANEYLIQNLRSFLMTLLPDYMVPSAYVRLSSLPLSPNGKLNRRELPAPDDEAYARQHYEAPYDGMERKLAEIWCELLNIDRISRHDNFFALGGHSLLIVRMLAQLRQFGLNTTVRDVFDAPSLAILALKLAHYKEVTVPPNLITKDTTKITPEMLSLITLSQADIDSIITQIPGGVSNIQDIYGLTPLQNGMLFHRLLANESDPYLIVSRLRFIDQLSLERYTDAMQQVIERHDILRTSIFWDGLSEPVQVVLRQVPFLLSEIALSESDDRYHLDVTNAPLIRLIASRDFEGKWVAMEVKHHLISDHSSNEILKKEVCAIMNGKIEVLKTPAPFRHFVAQARLGLSSVENTRFFTEMLGDIDEPTLPFGLREIDQDGLNIDEAHLNLSQTFSNQLRTLARNFQVSLASLCHLAWGQVLAKATGNEAVVFGTVLLSHLQDGTDNYTIMGPMINTLPIRLNIDAKSIVTAVHDTHIALSKLWTHEHAPLVLAQHCSHVSSSLPLFTSLLNYLRNQTTDDVRTSLAGVDFLESVGRTTYPLAMLVEDNDNLLCLSVEVLSSISATRICAYMEQALQSIAYALSYTPQEHLRKMTVMPSEERNLLLHNWNQTMASHLRVDCLHQLFEIQVELNGQATAVECQGKAMSYSELNIQTNRLAHYLIAQGVKPDDCIALCVERSITMIIGILGILKAGCAYVPLDPVFSSQRLTNILLDADPIYLLADSSGRNVLGDHHVPTIQMEKPLPSDLPAHNPDLVMLGLTSANLAYVIYTSGSTGKPKGVMIEHQPVVEFFENIGNNFDLNKQDKSCLFHSISFDISVWEIWNAFCHGSQLSIVPYTLTCNTDEFYDWICINGITALTQISSALKMLMRSKNKSLQLDQLRYVFFGAESSDRMNLDDWYEKDSNSQTVLVHMYGPTETLMVVTSWIWDKNSSCQPSVMPIGHSLHSRCIYLLDGQGELALLGAEGEIYIGGASIARGYLNRPELTAERFLPDPFSEEPAARMYRTGDLARYLPDGSLVFLGRIDQQVKIRGFRIELGEIEARLAEYPDVYEAIVQPYGIGSDAYLVAYAVADKDQSLVQNLRSHLLNLLPDYMIPAAYVFVPSLPLTPSGKVDRQALPAPDYDAFVRQQYEAPQGEMEEKLANIWCELLGIDRVSRYDNFFELGGHSLLVMHFVNKAKLYDIHIDARGLYSFPILKNLAMQIINRSRRFYCCDAAIPARSFGNETPLFFLPSGDGDISYAFELSHGIDKNIPVYALAWSSPENKQPSSIEEMASTMIRRMKKIQPNGPFAIAGYCSGGILALEIAKQLINDSYCVSFFGLIDTYAPSDKAKSLFTETEIFLFFLYFNFPIFKTSFDSKWWIRVSKLTLDEAIAEIRKINFESTNFDIEWEVILAKQRYNYQHLCAAYKINRLPIKIHLFKSIDFHFKDIFGEKIDASNECKAPKLGWENYDLSNDFIVISTNGDHLSMIRDPKNRSLLGKEMTKYLQQKCHENAV